MLIVKKSCSASLILLHVLAQKMRVSIGVQEVDRTSGSSPIMEWSTAQWRQLVDYNLGESAELRQLVMLGGIRDLGDEVAREIHRSLDRGVTWVTLADSAYPSELRFIPGRPLALLAWGNLEILDRPRVTVIGSRKANCRSLREAYHLGRMLAEGGFTTVSGGAYGCDISAHQGVLDHPVRPSPALVVFAGGFNHMGPRGNEWVFRSIVEQGGLLVTERLWDYPAKPLDFPVRNRIVSGLSWITVVVQAGLRSGALVTTNQALDQGREVVVLSQDSSDVRVSGTTQLISDGATQCRSAGEIFDLVREHCR